MLKPPPTHQRMENGPGFITNAMQVWIARDGCSAAYISPVSPLENAFVESFNSRYRYKFLNIELFIPVQGAKFLALQHRIENYTYKPHLALQGPTRLGGNHSKAA